MPTGDGETLAAGTPSPVPPPPPTTTTTTPTATTASSSPASTHRHRRHRTFSSSSSSSSSSSLSTVSSAASSPSPSPPGRGATSSTTSVPFSWEHHPGIPKTRLVPAGTPSSSAPTPLPLPPPLRAPTTSSSRQPRHHHHHTRRRRASGKQRPTADPFAAALAECTRERGGTGAGTDDASLMDALFPARAPPPASSSSAPTTSRRWPSITSVGGVVGLLDLYGCKSAMGMGGVVAEGAFVVRRPVAVVRAVPAGRAGPGRAGRR